MKKEDKRVVRSKNQLKAALLKLLKEKNIDKISTSELCKTAHVNRNTFYAHYAHPEELLSEIQQEFTDRIVPIMQSLFENNDRQTAIVSICTTVKKYSSFCLLFQKHFDESFLQNILADASRETAAYWRKMGFAGTDDDAQMILSFVTAGCRDAMVRWLTTENTKTPEQMADFLEKIAMNGVSRYIQKK